MARGPSKPISGPVRKNLLGKRADNPDRSLTVIGLALRLHRRGLPKTITLELFKPFTDNRLERRGLNSSVKAAKYRQPFGA
jgi:DNA-directed RNA polymerase subunit beta'